MHNKKGLLIAIEGIDGSGKSLLITNLQSKLASLKKPVITTKEPGGSALGNYLRTMLQEKPIPICAKAEFLLFTASRAQHFEERIIPALKQNKIVISDRLADSSIVYQGFGRGLDISMIERINAWAMNGYTSDITFYVKIDIETALTRRKKRNIKATSFEKESTVFFERLISGFDTLYKTKKNVIILNGKLSPEELTKQAMQSILHKIQN